MSLNSDATILIVDDDPGHARLIERSLARASVASRIKRFGDGQEVLDFLAGQAQSGDAYLLLLDIRMPKLDGAEVLRQIKEDAHLRRIPVIMLTTTDDPREIARCRALGCSEYLVKPVEDERLAEAISAFGQG